MTSSNPSNERDIRFTVSSALLKELGERLVGRPAVALAELIKNSYDADATKVEVHLGEDSLVISDNGQGMTENEFETFWMRIGSQHKREMAHSRKLKRPLTGSKGVGRLAVQFLAHCVQVSTKSADDDFLVATVDWDQAAQSDLLTQATAKMVKPGISVDFPANMNHGTIIKLTGLKQAWTEEEVKIVARQIWMLQPPIASEREQMRFVVEFTSDKPGLEKDFGKQIEAILDIWHARIQGRIENDKDVEGKPVVVNQVVVSFSDGKKYQEKFPLSESLLSSVTYDIRIYDLIGKQRFYIPVGTAREYLEQFGGVSVYDNDFRLPFYGRETDWLGIETDHSHRITLSKVLPERLQEPAGLNNLPTTTRILGSVHINTSLEEKKSHDADVEAAETSHEYLQISITRDRLIDNKAHEQLRKIVRTGLDYYAMLQTRRMAQKRLEQAPTQPLTSNIEQVESVLEQNRSSIPMPIYTQLKTEIANTLSSVELERTRNDTYLSLLGALATAGMAASAFQHEIERRLATIESAMVVVCSENAIVLESSKEAIKTINDSILAIRKNRSLFSSFVEKESRQDIERYRIATTLKGVFSKIEGLLRGTQLDVSDIPDEARFPLASYMELEALFQNVFTNASNAMLDSTVKAIKCSLEIGGTNCVLRIEDTGSGLKLKGSEELFEPFVRYQKISQERRALGLGGTGLGLTIVRMIADKINCSVHFIAPSKGFSTCFSVQWREQ